MLNIVNNTTRTLGHQAQKCIIQAILTTYRVRVNCYSGMVICICKHDCKHTSEHSSKICVCTYTRLYCVLYCVCIYMLLEILPCSWVDITHAGTCRHMRVHGHASECQCRVCVRVLTTTLVAWNLFWNRE